MGNILEFAGYVLAATVMFGAVIAYFLLRAYWFQPGAVVPHPSHLKLPTEAANAVRQALEGVKRKQAAATGAEKEELSREVLRLESRLEKLEQRTFNDQRDYHYALKLREGAWLQWKELHDRASLLGKRLPPEMRDLLKEAEGKYVKSHRAVEKERHTAIARDMVSLEEIRGQGVLTRAGVEEDGGAAPPERETEAAEGAIAPQQDPEAGLAPEDSGLRQAHFKQPDMAKAGRRYVERSFELSEIRGVLRDEDLSGCDFENVEFRGVHVYHNCNFSHANLGMIRLERQGKPHQFSGCDFSGAHFTQSKIAYAVFSRCDLSRTHWAGAELDHVKIVDCRMEDVFWEQVDLSLTAMPPDLAAQLDFSEAAAPPRTPTHPAGAELPQGNGGSTFPAPQSPGEEDAPNSPRDAGAPPLED